MFFHPLKHRKQLSAKHQYSGGLLALRGRQNMVWPALAIALFCILPACNRSDSDRGTDGDTGDIANDVANDTASANCQVGRNNPPTNDNNYLLAKVGARYYRINSTGSSGTLLSLPDGYYLYALDGRNPGYDGRDSPNKTPTHAIFSSGPPPLPLVVANIVDLQQGYRTITPQGFTHFVEQFERDWSGDFQYLLYGARNYPAPIESLQVFDLSTGNTLQISQLPGPNSFIHPESYSWSPNDAWVSYVAKSDSSELYVVQKDGANLLKLSSNLAKSNNRYASWSPTSQHIAFVADDNSDNIPDLFSIEPDSAGLARLNDTLATGGEILSYKWSPDGNWVAYYADQDTDEVFELYSVRSDGTGRVKLNEPLQAGEKIAESFYWAPDSSRLVYYSNSDNIHSKFDIYSIQPDGSGRIKLNEGLITPSSVAKGVYVIEEASRSSPWSPDSTKVAFVVQGDLNTDGGNDLYGNALGEVYTVNPDGAARTRVNGDRTIVFGITEWLADGSRLFFYSLQGNNRKHKNSVSPMGASLAGFDIGSLRTGAISPDNKWQIFHDDKNFYSIPTSFEQPLLRLNCLVDLKGVSKYILEFHGWSKDSKWIYFQDGFVGTIDPHVQGSTYVASPDGAYFIDINKVSGLIIDNGNSRAGGSPVHWFSVP